MRSAEPDTLERAIWARASVSTLAHHGACCDRARGWIVAMARSHDFAATDGLDYTAPRWLTRRWRWGPTRWPIAWCEAVRAEAIDCGVFAAFAVEISAQRASMPIPDRCFVTGPKKVPRIGDRNGPPCPKPSIGSAQRYSIMRFASCDSGRRRGYMIRPTVFGWTPTCRWDMALTSPSAASFRRPCLGGRTGW